MNKMCHKHFCVAINYVSDQEANFYSYDDKININNFTMLYTNPSTYHSDPVKLI